MAKKPLNFEKALSELEAIVERMENEELKLEEALQNFEKGIALSSECQQALQKAELKVSELIEKNKKLLEQSFDIEE